MEKRGEESLAFSVRVFTVQEEEMAEEEHVDTCEVIRLQRAVLYTYLLN